MNDRIKMILPLAKSFSCIEKIIILENQEELIGIMNNYKTVFPRNYNPKYFLIEPPIPKFYSNFFS